MERRDGGGSSLGAVLDSFFAPQKSWSHQNHFDAASALQTPAHSIGRATSRSPDNTHQAPPDRHSSRLVQGSGAKFSPQPTSDVLATTHLQTTTPCSIESFFHEQAATGAGSFDSISTEDAFSGATLAQELK